MKVAIASCTHPASVGGLAAYQRELATNLSALRQVEGQFLSVENAQASSQQAPNSLQWPSSTLMPHSQWKRQHRLISRLASRRPLLPVADTLSRALNPRPAWKVGLQNVDALHFVGTGWDIIGYPLWREAQSAGIPFTIWPAVHPQSWGDDAFDVRLYRKAHAIFCQSDYEREHLMARGVPASKLIRCGLPPMCHTGGDAITARQKWTMGDRPAVLFLGRRDEGKGYPALLDAWPLVLQACPEALLLLAGPGPVDEARLAQSPSSSIRDLGCPSEQEKADAYAACDVFCLPSAHESFGIVYVEAWSYGKPVICGTAPASRELVEHQVSGLWSDQQPHQLASALLQLLNDRERAQTMGAAGLQRQRTWFTQESMINTHMRAWTESCLN